MWEDNDTEWTHFRQDVMAHNRASAALLVQFLKHVNSRRLHTTALEVIDLQRYRFITKPKKVQAALRERLHLPFVFVVGRN
jgi:hypothetical protein